MCLTLYHMSRQEVDAVGSHLSKYPTIQITYYTILNVNCIFCSHVLAVAWAPYYMYRHFVWVPCRKKKSSIVIICKLHPIMNRCHSDFRGCHPPSWDSTFAGKLEVLLPHCLVALNNWRLRNCTSGSHAHDVTATAPLAVCTNLGL